MRLQSFRRSLGAAVLAVGAVLVTAVAAPAGAEDAFVPGSGEAESRLVRVGPSAGRLSFAPVVGVTYASYQNAVARALSRVVDYAALDDSMPPELKAAAPPVRVDSTDDGAEEGTTRRSPEGAPLGTTRQEARATAQPRGEAVFTLGDASLVPGAVEVAGGRAVSRAAIVDDATREAAGAVSFGRIVLGDGAVVLRDVTWTARQRTGADAGSTGSFRVAVITVGDRTLEPPEGGPTPEQWEQLNAALAPLGLRVDAPRVEVDGDLVAITPLGIRVGANQVGRTVGPPLIDGLQPVREPVAGGIIEHEPEAGSLFTLADLVLGTAAGSGIIELQLGGSTAFTEGESYDDPFGAFELGDVGAGPVALGSGGSAGDGVPASGGAASGRSDLADAPAGAGDAAGDLELAGAGRLPGRTGGAAVVVGLVGLLAVLGLAGADWWRLRTEPRRIVGA